ncbi:MAG: hypothetical protein ABMA14_04525 [Hyphomonadaceae bacterium]
MMIIRSALLATTLLSAACVAPPAPVEAAAAAGGCDLKVDFASIGTGIDGVTLQKVDALLSGDTGISTIDRQRWGKEGEITLCVDTRTTADATRLFGAVKGVFPASSVKPISVETGAGQHFRVPTP